MSDPNANDDRANDWLRPSWGRLAAAGIVAAAAFSLPQSVPLEWYPLNHPGDRILYLEIACASDKNGEVRVYYDTTRGFNEFDSIRFTISPTVQTYTYTFPLPDAPIVGLRMNPVADGGTLTIKQMRIIDRRESEICRLDREMFTSTGGVASILPYPDGWMITSAPGSTDPIVSVTLPFPIRAEGMSLRNVQRCLISTGYLALMLMILLSAVLLVFWHPRNARELAARLCFLAALALVFALVGNRGLIRDSIHYARWVPADAQK
jgi:hypothetical protein